MLAAAGCVVAFCAPAAASRLRYPVIGCFNFSLPGPNLYSMKYKPYGSCYVSTGIDGITHTHWSHWGAKRATGRGYFLDSLGFQHKATMTLYGLFHPCLLGAGEKAYSRLRIVWGSVVGGGVQRPGGTAVFKVTPTDLGC